MQSKSGKESESLPCILSDKIILEYSLVKQISKIKTGDLRSGPKQEWKWRKFQDHSYATDLESKWS